VGPLLTVETGEAMRRALAAGLCTLDCSLNLGLSRDTVELSAAGFSLHGQHYPWPKRLKENTVYYWDSREFAPVARFGGALIKLKPTVWGPPTFEIDGIKMLPSAKLSPWQDAEQKVALIEPRGKCILDTCGGLGYFAAWCLRAGASEVHSFEKSADVLWLRTLNPWSPQPSSALHLRLADVHVEIAALSNARFDAILHDPPRFGIAGELYAQAFYVELARVLKRGGKMFHYTGTPNQLSSGRDLPLEVIKRLQRAGFEAVRKADGVLAMKR